MSQTPLQINEQKALSFFENLDDSEKIYETLIALGKKLDPLDPKDQIDSNLVKGCQSTVYLVLDLKDDKCFFKASSDALITKGLLFVVLQVYNGLTPKEIVQSQPTFIEKLNLESLLSPSRSNGLMSILLKIKQLAVQSLNQ